MTHTTDWHPSRNAALQQLQRFLPHAGSQYANTRNYDNGLGCHDNVSQLSPWLRHRSICEAEVLESVLAVQPASTADKFIQEVFWRCYWKGRLEMQPDIWQSYQKDVVQLHSEGQWFERTADATAGGTGIQCFDSWCEELITTGYLHNHARMWFASIWIYTLKLPWQLGAKFFLQHLLDGDPASNTLSWRWVAGLQTKGKTYLARADNIAKYTNNRFNPMGQLATEALALTDSHEFERIALPDTCQLHEGVRAGLLITCDDLAPQPLPGNPDYSCVAGFSAAGDAAPGSVSPKVIEWTNGLMQDALAQQSTAKTHSEKDSEPLFSTVAQVVDWAVSKELSCVVCAYIPVGPNKDALGTLEVSLHHRDIKLIQVRRAWDSTVWPHAGKGFFALKKKIPMLLSELMPDVVGK